jgi:hypothetical protein
MNGDMFSNCRLCMVTSTALFGSWWLISGYDGEAGRGRTKSDFFMGVFVELKQVGCLSDKRVVLIVRNK